MYSDSRRDFLRHSGILLICSAAITRLFANVAVDSEEMNEKVIGTFKLAPELQLLALMALEKEHGAIIRELADEHSKKRWTGFWKKLGEEVKTNDIDTLIDLLWHGYCKKDGFKYTVQQKGEVTQMHCTYCPLVEIYKKHNALDWGYHLMCKTDHYITEGFNGNILFKRTKTLMQGDDCCDHSYRIKPRKS
jgi:hypothetical protein